jgi:hypothetical protein
MWLGASEWQAAGGSETAWAARGASETLWLGASGRIGASEWLGASRIAASQWLGASEQLGGGSEQVGPIGALGERWAGRTEEK